MFGFQKYLDKLYQIHWYFNETDLSDIEQLLNVKFKQINDYFMLQEVYYTYIDILIGLESMNFEVIKQDNTMTIKILKIRSNNI